MNRLQLSNQLQNQCKNIEIAFAGADMILIVRFHLQQHRGLFCVKGRFSGLSGIKTDHVWPEIRPLGFKGLKELQDRIKNKNTKDHYLSPTIQNELIELLATEVEKENL